MEIPQSILDHVENKASKLAFNPKLQNLYKNAALQTIKTVFEPCDDGTIFVLTGDIPAMWLRDSTAQVTHYVKLAKDEEVKKILSGVILRQLKYIEIDPYANAFNKEANGKGHTSDRPRNDPWVFERKYEIDSLCYPIRLLYLFWKETGDETIIKEKLENVATIITNVWTKEQHHDETSPYRFFRDRVNVPWDTIYNDGLGAPVKYTGMTWSGFRPSDDGCQYGYLTASEMFSVVVLKYMAEMLNTVCNNKELATKCLKLSSEIDKGIKEYCIIDHPVYGKIYCCETDGDGHYSMIDDANIPSLLSIPYIGYSEIDDEIYQNTRKFLLSKENPFYFEGEYAKGIGSRHTPNGFIWHMSLIMQALTTKNQDEIELMLNYIVNSDADTGYLHEGFDCNNPKRFSRPWFTWPNSLFAELIDNLF